MSSRSLRALGMSLLLCALHLGCDVWEDMDTTSLPLDVETVRTQKEGDISIQVLRYTSEIWNGKPIRVFAMYARPEGMGKFPAILHIHGGGQTASPRDVAEMVQRGYACLSFDWTGKTKDRTEYTDWPEDIGTHYTVKPTPKHNKLYHAVLAARRGITFLTQQSEVDAERIGSYGISWGGYLMWLVNGTDKRLKASVAVYGCGGLLTRGYQYGGEAGKMSAKETELWLQNFEPQRYAHRQVGPIMYLSGSNDFFGWPPAAAKTLRSCKVDTRQVFLAGVNHGVGLEAAEAAYRWFAHYLKEGPPLPASPHVQIVIGADGVPVANVKIAEAANAESAWVEYSIGSNLSPGRCWRKVDLKCTATAQAVLPIMDPAQELQVIAQVRYKGGYRLSSVPLSVVPQKLGKAQATLKRSDVICDFTDGIGGWGPAVGSTQLYGARSDIALDPTGHNGKPCLKIVPLLQPFTHASVTLWRVGDPQWRREDNASLSLWVKGFEKGLGLTAQVLPQQVGQKNYSMVAPLKLEKGWQQVVVKPEQFKEQLPPGATLKKDQFRKMLPSWKDVQCIIISGPVIAGENPCIGRVEWLPVVP